MQITIAIKHAVYSMWMQIWVAPWIKPHAGLRAFTPWIFIKTLPCTEVVDKKECISWYIVIFIRWSPKIQKADGFLSVILYNCSPRMRVFRQVMFCLLRQRSGQSPSIDRRSNWLIMLTHTHTHGYTQTYRRTSQAACLQQTTPIIRELITTGKNTINIIIGEGERC